MNDANYVLFEAKLLPVMRAKVQALHSTLIEMGLGAGTVSDVDIVDRDVERGIGFSINEDNDQRCLAIEMMLTDGDVSGFEDPEHPGRPCCGILLTVIGPGGRYMGEFGPRDCMSEPGSSSVAELARRANLLDVDQAARYVLSCVRDLDSSRHTGLAVDRK